MTPEGKVKAQVKKYLDSIGAWYCMPATGGYGKSGVPDFLVCWKGRFVGIETKAPGGKATELQKMQIKKIDAAGGYAFVYDGVSGLALYFDAVQATFDVEALERTLELNRGNT